MASRPPAVRQAPPTLAAAPLRGGIPFLFLPSKKPRSSFHEHPTHAAGLQPGAGPGQPHGLRQRPHHGSRARTRRATDSSRPGRQRGLRLQHGRVPPRGGTQRHGRHRAGTGLADRPGHPQGRWQRGGRGRGHWLCAGRGPAQCGQPGWWRLHGGARRQDRQERGARLPRSGAIEGHARHVPGCQGQRGGWQIAVHPLRRGRARHRGGHGARAQDLGHPAPVARDRPRHRTGRQGFPGQRNARQDPAAREEEHGQVACHPGHLLEERRAPEGGRPAGAERPGAVHAPDRPAGRQGVLRRRDRPEDRGRDGPARRCHQPAGPARIQGGRARAHARHLPGL